MTAPIAPHAIAALLATLAVAPGVAQELALGTWTGTMTPPGGEAIPVTYEVGTSGDTLSVVMRSVHVAGDMLLRDVRLEGEELRFWWEPDVRVECTLRRAEDGSFEGPCSDGSNYGAMRMVPPDPSGARP
ncbi:MAG TPA: hypothetical protein VFQ22_02760 [Longimicrobiales bacterium]|nr:hypothetical protein [Longimicrobiales bacterium]